MFSNNLRVLSSLTQTDVIDRSDRSCQTESSEIKDFQVQVQLQEQGEPIATQTDSTAQCDFQVQVNMPRDSDSIATQTIKEEIRMPNTQSSVAQTPAKKQKLTSVSTSSAQSPTVSIDVSQPPEPLTNGSGDQLGKNQAEIEPGVDDSSASKAISNENIDQSNNVQAVLDDGILNSEVYQIYCRNEDPKEALKEIRQMKSCAGLWKPTRPFPDEKDFKNACETALDRLWKLEPRLTDSKFDQIKKFANGNINLSQQTRMINLIWKLSSKPTSHK